MKTLKELNFQKCLEVLENFHEAVPVDVLDKELKEKKEQAELALEHIGEIFMKDTDMVQYGNCSCTGGQKTQDAQQAHKTGVKT